MSIDNDIAELDQALTDMVNGLAQRETIPFWNEEAPAIFKAFGEENSCSPSITVTNGRTSYHGVTAEQHAELEQRINKAWMARLQRAAEAL